MSEANRDQKMSCRQVFHWHKQFREGRSSSVAVKQLGKSVSISTNVTVHFTGIWTLVVVRLLNGTLSYSKRYGTKNIEELFDCLLFTILQR